METQRHQSQTQGEIDTASHCDYCQLPPLICACLSILLNHVVAPLSPSSGLLVAEAMPAHSPDSSPSQILLPSLGCLPLYLRISARIEQPHMKFKIQEKNVLKTNEPYPVSLSGMAVLWVRVLQSLPALKCVLHQLVNLLDCLPRGKLKWIVVVSHSSVGGWVLSSL